MAMNPQSERELAAAVRELTTVVSGLQDMIRHDYPKRSEIERDFVSKYGIKRRRVQFALVTVVAIVASYVFAMGTVSYCFLQGPGITGNASQACNVLPGYADVIEYNAERREIYNDVIQTTLDNERAIEQLRQDHEELKRSKP